MNPRRPECDEVLLNFIELFAGIGGFRYGLERVQFKNENICQSTTTVGDSEGQSVELNNKGAERLFNCVWANEWRYDPIKKEKQYAWKIYQKQYGTKEINTEDITKIKAGTIPDHDVLCGGSPCQSFSVAGKGGGFDDIRGTLFFDYARILKEKKPRYFIFENVKGLLSSDGGRTFTTIIGVFSDIGYDLQWEVLNSKNFGVPQNRERVFIVGHLRGTRRPEVFPIGKDVRISMHRQRQVSPTITKRYFKQGQSDPYIFNEKEVKIRRLTPTECERLQGFPDGWTEGISDTQRYKCLGNAVTTNVITEIGRRLSNEPKKT